MHHPRPRMLAAAPLVLALPGPAALAQEREVVPQEAEVAVVQDATLAEACEQARNLRTLTLALTMTGLDDYLADNGPITILAPTDQAFAKLNESFLDDLVDPNNLAALRAVLAYHLVPGEVTAEHLASSDTVATLGTQRLDIESFPAGVVIDGKARIIDADMRAANGMLHTIDTVLLPSTRTVFEVLDDDPRFSVVHRLIRRADLEDEFDDRERRITFFAPTNDAFRSLSPGLADVLGRRSNRGALRALLQSLTIERQVSLPVDSLDVALQSARGKPIELTTLGSALVVNRSRVGRANLDALNGVIHELTTLELPADLRITAGEDLMIGVEIREFGGVVASQMGAEGARALEVQKIVRNGHAERAGLRRGDIILSIDGMPATTRNLERAKSARGFGRAVELRVFRDRRELLLSVPVGLRRE